MSDCIFCKIIAGELSCSKVYEDDRTLAFLDIHPIAPGHTLVISREHYEELTEVPPEDLAPLIAATQRVAVAATAGLDASGFNVLLSNGPSACQVVPHVHFHIVPRSDGDGLRMAPPRQPFTDAQRDSVLDKIRAHL